MSKDAVIFDEKWQEATFGHMLTNKQFFEKCKTYIKPSWFQNPKINAICQMYYTATDEKKRYLTLVEFEALKISSLVDMKQARSYIDTIEKCKITAKDIRIEIISEEMTAWAWQASARDLIEKGALKYNQGEGSKIIDFFANKLEQIKRINFSGDAIVDLSNPINFYTTFDETRTNGVSTGSRLLDKLMVGDVTYRKVKEDGSEEIDQVPGFIKGFTTVVLGPSNSGKSSLMATFARNVALQRKKVLFITHEGTESMNVDRIFKSYLEMNATDISEKLKTEEGRRDLINKTSEINNYLFYKHHNFAGSMYVEDVISIIREIHAREIAKDGHGLDVVIDDYPANLMSRAHANQKLERRHTLANNYRQFSSLGDELGLHMILPMQVNRSGYTKAKNGDELLGQDDVAEAFEVCQIADNVISINRSDEDKKNKTVRLYIDKNRAGETGSVFWSQTDLSKSLMFKPGTLDEGWSRYGDSIQTVLEKTFTKFDSKTVGKLEKEVGEKTHEETT
jgi:replicative DNA helicase